MARYRGPRNRIARRFGTNVFGRARNPLIHKQHPPGMHGARRRKKSDYGLQLEEKQKLKAVYGMISEKQLVNYYKKSLKKQGTTAEILAQMLECRLDTVVYRLKFAPTIFAAHQLVSHGHILVDGKKVDRRSFQVEPGMVISIKEGSRKHKQIISSLENSSVSVPEYMEVDAAKFSGKLLTLPAVDQMPWSIQVNLPEVCDFLAHTT
ncbi:MAG: 30S ribosomal protein S4 [Chlamydiia bacterium]|nr:30S ribosomal protein S4 [Chlamydiia bacterium]